MQRVAQPGKWFRREPVLEMLNEVVQRFARDVSIPGGSQSVGGFAQFLRRLAIEAFGDVRTRQTQKRPKLLDVLAHRMHRLGSIGPSEVFQSRVQSLGRDAANPFGDAFFSFELE